MPHGEIQLELFSENAFAAPSVTAPAVAAKPVPAPVTKVTVTKAAPAPAKSRHFAFPEGFDPAAGNIREHLLCNMAALRLRSKLSKSGKPATNAEKLTLAKYIGWGGLPDVFEDHEERHEKVRKELTKLLGKDGTEQLRHSCLNAHFTSLEVVRFVWNCIRRAGFKGGRVIEPAVGTGNFIGAIPADLAAECHLTAVELEPVTADVCRMIYGDSVTVYQAGFQDAPLPENYFDLAIGNVPFGDYSVADRALPKARIHDYFFMKALQKVRPGGLVAFLTSTGTLDKENDAHRRFLSQRAELVGAFRLPDCAFKQNAHAEVTTDLIVLRRREQGANLDDPTAEAWVHTDSIRPAGSYRDVVVNRYFVSNPEAVMGDLEADWRQRAQCKLPAEKFPKRLLSAVAMVPQGVYSSSKTPVSVAGNVGIAKRTDRNGAFALDGDGRLCCNRGGLLALYTEGSATAHKRIRAMLAIRDATRRVLEAAGRGDNQVADEGRAELNALYDTFRKTYGFLNGQTNRRLFRNDPEAALLLALENYDPDDEEATTKAALFSPLNLRRFAVENGTLSPADAVASCLNRYGRVDEQKLCEMTGRDWATLWPELNGTLIFRDPATCNLETADAYLSGDVRKKLATAKTAAAHEAEFTVNVGALTAVQPEDIAPDQIGANLGASWIPPEIVEDFIADLLGITKKTARLRVNHLPALGTWRVVESYDRSYAFANTERFGTKRMTAVDLLDCGLNLRMPAVYD